MVPRWAVGAVGSCQRLDESVTSVDLWQLASPVYSKYQQLVETRRYDTRCQTVEYNTANY